MQPTSASTQARRNWNWDGHRLSILIRACGIPSKPSQSPLRLRCVMDNPFSMLDSRTQTAADEQYYSEIQKFFAESDGDTLGKLRNFSKFVPRQNLALFLAKNEIFKHLLDVHGYIVECGVFMGG